MILSSSSSSSRSLMAILSGNFISSSAIQLQNHVFLIPWVKKKMKMGAISCSEGRDYSNSGPVRYIPKNSSGNKESVSLPKDQSDNMESLKSNGKRVELYRSGLNSCSNSSSVVDTNFEKQHENPIKKINNNDGFGTRSFAQSNVERIQLSRSSQTSCISRTSVADNGFQNENGKPVSNVRNDVGLGRVSVVQPNVGRIESTAQASSSGWSIFVDTEFENQIEKPMNNKNNDSRLDTSGIVRPSVERIESYESAETSCSGRNGVVDPQLPNINGNPINNVKYGGELGTSTNVRSDLLRTKLSKSVEASCSSRSFMVDTDFQSQNNRPINKIKFDVGLGTSRVVQSNVQTVEDSNSEQTSCSGRSFILNTEGLGVGEEFDGGMHFEDYEFMEEFEGLSIEKSNDVHGMLGVSIKKDVQKSSVELLAVRALTALELRNKLQGKNFPLHIVDAVIRDFQARGVINDGLYAETFTRSRWSSSTWGPRRIKKALCSKGVSEVEAEKAIKLVFNDASASGDQESDLGMSKLSMDRLFAQASKQWMRSCDVSINKRKSRIIWWLQYRGFSGSIISIVLKKLESKHPT